jgi:saccharopine dehydrogenase (NAD+, L-lysine-forming)
MLRRLLELGCSLVDYERILDDRNRRLVFFGVHAGHAGMIETLWCLSRRLRGLGLHDPLDGMKHAYEYDDLQAAKDHLRQLGERIRRDGLGDALHPLVFGVSGYGNVSRGAQEVLDCLPVTEVTPEALPAAAARGGSAPGPLLKVVFKEEHMVRPVEPGAPFELQDYYDHPEKYRGDFERHLPHLDVLVNTIYWEERYPRLVTREWARRQAGRARLQVIGDISCDIEGSIELTLKATQPDAPCFTYDPASDSVTMGCAGPGPAVMAVDNLPCELPREASQHFSRTLRGMVPALAAADWTAPFERLDLPPELKRAVIVHRGKLTPDYAHLKDFLDD